MDYWVIYRMDTETYFTGGKTDGHMWSGDLQLAHCYDYKPVAKMMCKSFIMNSVPCEVRKVKVRITLA